MGDALAAALAHVQRGQHEHRDSDRHVHPEDPLPAQILREDAAHQDACGGAASTDSAPRAKRFVALAALGKSRRDDRQGGGRDDRRAKALNTARDNEHRLGPRQAADEGSGGEEREAAHEHKPPPEQVGCPPSEE